MTKKNPPLFSVTPAAVAQIRKLLSGREKTALGIRVGIRTRGCSGKAYFIEFVDDRCPTDEVVEVDGLKIFIEGKATLFLIGTQMDFVRNQLESGFVFKNPNEKGRCGCGESFHV